MRAICPDHLMLINLVSARNDETPHYAFLSTLVGSSLLLPNTLSLRSVLNVQTKFNTRTLSTQKYE
jgi:hypothetical protein